MYYDKISDLKKLIPSVDNLSPVFEVYSILVAPIFGHRKSGEIHADNTLWGPDKTDNNVTGILQLINKVDGKITENDIVSV